MADSSTQVLEQTKLSTFVRFGGISGVGWLLDFGLLFLLVKAMHWPVFLSNLVSASVAALTVFLISRKIVFQAKDNSVLLRTLLYCIYTLGVILLASAAITYVTMATASASRHLHLHLSIAVCAMIAKIIVTPLNFLANFVVARFMSEYAPATA